MKRSIFAVVLLLTPLIYAQEQRDPEEAHVYWTNKITNNNNAETVTEFSSHTAVQTNISLDKEGRDQLKQELIEALKNDPEFKKQIVVELLKDQEFRGYLMNVLMPQGSYIRFGM